MQKKRPRVIANFAMTWDGKITTRNLTPSDFSSRQDKRRLLEIRAKADALLVGRTTLEKENTPLGLPAEDLRAARVARGSPPYPLRVIVSNEGQFDPSLRIFQRKISPIVIYSTSRMPLEVRENLTPHAEIHLHEGDSVDIGKMLAHLRSHYRVKRLVSEAGPRLFRRLLEQDFVDEIYLTLCPLVFGGEKALTLTGLPGDFLPHTVRCRLASRKVIGEECFLHYRVLR